MKDKLLYLTTGFLVIGALILSPIRATSQTGGAIMLYSDELGTSCNIADNPSGFVSVYVFHRYHTGVTGSSFKIDNNGTGFVFFGDTLCPTCGEFGSTDIGADFSYGGCHYEDIHFVTAVYQATSSSGPCSSLMVARNPISVGNYEGPVANDCGFNNVPANGSMLTVNCPDESMCGFVLPVERTTWGKVKALYE